MKRRAFTMVELMVVLAIIATLSAILFPVFVQAKRQAKQGACAANLHQFGVALTLYAGDYDDGLAYAPPPLAKYLFSLGEWQETRFLSAFEGPDLKTLLLPYQVVDPIWRCPEDEIALSAKMNWPAGSYYESTGGSYDYDLYAAFEGRQFATIDRPAEWRVMVDAEAFHCGDHEFWAPGRRGNVLFYDCHLKAVLETQMARTDRTNFPQ